MNGSSPREWLWPGAVLSRRSIVLRCSHFLNFKRWFDFVLSAVGLIGSAPLWGLIALAIRMEDSGPIFYRQVRTGYKGRIFEIVKFRSMVPDAERETGVVLAGTNDIRVTGVGRLMRATALDELPQLLNILKGDMTFVGPRPERPELVARFIKEVAGYDRRLLVRPGLTGIAQIYGRYDSSPSQKLRYDLLYIRRQNLWLDLRLILFSFWITFWGRWERRGRKFGVSCRRRGAS